MSAADCTVLDLDISRNPVCRVAFASDAPGAAVTAGFLFHVPVRFDTDALEVDLAAFTAGEIPHIPLVEIRV